MQHSLSIVPSSPIKFARSGRTLFWEGDNCQDVYELQSGIVRGVAMLEDGHRQVIGFFFAGDEIGHPVTQRYRYSAEAITDLNYCFQTSDHWQKALSESCRADGKMLRSIGAEQDPFYRRGMLVSRHNALCRVAAFLVNIIDRLPKNRGAYNFALPQMDIASYLALTPETVCRSLRRLKELGVIAMPSHDRLCLIDRKFLNSIASG